MLTIIIKRNDEPKVIQFTQETIMRELSAINGAEMLLEDSWTQGLRKVRTPYACLVEADCTLSASYISSNVGLMNKTTKSLKGGGYNKLAMIASCLGVIDFGNRVYNYKMEQVEHKKITDWQSRPNRNKASMKLYHVQVGFVPGAILRMSALNKNIDTLPWDEPNLVKMSTDISFHFWNTGRRIQVNPNTTYVSNQMYLENPPLIKTTVPDKAANIFTREGIS